GPPRPRPRAVKAMGVTYATSPQGADHTAGLCYKSPLSREGQVLNSLRFQLRAAACDTFGYCLNSLPGRQASIYELVSSLLNARFGASTTPGDILEAAKRALRDELAFNRRAGVGTGPDPLPSFIREEPLPPTGHVFDVDPAEVQGIWDLMDRYREPEKVWEVRLPATPRFLIGAGVHRKLGDRAAGLGMKRALIIADPVMQGLGRTETVAGLLERRGVEARVYTGVQPDPPLEAVERAAAFYRGQGCDGIIALGGGSAIDTAKAAAVRVSRQGDLRELENLVGGKAKITPPLPPLIAVPTTSGTGSETNQYAIITDPERRVKFTMMSDHLVPRLAVIDPELCATMPPAVTAETGIDALAHCVEGYAGMNEEYHPYYESLALYGVRLVGRSLRRAFRDGSDLDARKDLCIAASFGGIAFTKGLGLGHAVSHVLGAFHHISHGTGCALGLLCHVRAGARVRAGAGVGAGAEASEEQFRDLAWALDRSEDLEAALLRLYRDLGVPARIRDAGVEERDLARVAFEVSTNAVNLAANPRPVTEKKILELLRELY
ncbi:MAG: iron-containing alcohol dehydrogenase, partial [Spirochaetota bacterium]